MINLIRGWFGEKLTTFGMWLRLDESIYKRIHNIIIPAANGSTQIDHVLVSVYGIFVIETKNIKGWIFGSENDDQWCQSIFGKKSIFQNPLRQNYRHTKCLSEFLDIDHDLLKSIVFFIGECEFKTQMPVNVMSSGLSSYVRSFNRHLFNEAQVEQIYRRLLELKRNPPIRSAEHLQSLHARHTSESTCPKCGGELKKRTAKRGPNAGGEFLGCSNYPECKFTRNL